MFGEQNQESLFNDAPKSENVKRKTAKKWIKNPNDAVAIEQGCYFDESEAQFVIDFIQTFCCFSQGKWAGKPVVLIQWQIDLIYQLYGWKRADSTRRFRTCYVEISKKNGKSALVSCLALYHLIADGEAGAWVAICACDREQASTVFDETLNMVTASPALSRIIQPVPSKKTLTHAASNSKMLASSAEIDSKDGKNASLVVFDELHRQRTDAMWKVWQYAGRAREQPLRIVITTAGYDRNSICYKQHDFTKKVMSGILQDTSHYGVIYAANPEDVNDLENPAVWRKANPSLGITLSEEDFRNDVREVLESPTDLNNFLRLRLNIWTQSETRYIPRKKWDACGEKPIDFESLKTMRAWGGCDLASTQDVTAFVLLFEDGTVLARYWMPEENAHIRERKDRVTYLTWARQGLVTLTEGDRVDYDQVRKDIVELCAEYDVQSIAIDPHNATQIATQLRDDGLNMQFFRQGFLSMNAPTKELERLVARGEINHGGDPVLTWMADNCTVSTDSSDNVKLDKKKSREKIDGMVALVEAVAMRTADIGDQGGGEMFVIDLDD